MKKSNICGHGLLVFDSLPSTSDYIRENDTQAGAVVRALTQSAGRGRRGNSFISREGGLYFSMKLPRSMPDEDMWAVTFMAANAVCDAISLHGGDPRIKWVNDVYISDKKVCGILCEVRADHIILGVGVNVEKTDLPEEIAHIATTLEDAGIHITADRLLEDVIKYFDVSFAQFDLRETVEKYRRRCMLIDRDIIYTENGEKKQARAIGIADNGNLLCEKDGMTFALHSGEVHTVRRERGDIRLSPSDISPDGDVI